MSRLQPHTTIIQHIAGRHLNRADGAAKCPVKPKAGQPVTYLTNGAGISRAGSVRASLQPNATWVLPIRKRQPTEHRWLSFVIFAHMQPHHCHSCLSRTYDPWCVKCGCKTAPIIQAKKKVRFVTDPFSDKLRAVITEPDEWPSEPGPAQKKRKPFTKYGSLNTNFAAPFIRQLRREIDLQGRDAPQVEWPSVKELLLP